MSRSCYFLREINACLFKYVTKSRILSQSDLPKPDLSNNGFCLEMYEQTLWQSLLMDYQNRQLEATPTTEIKT